MRAAASVTGQLSHRAPLTGWAHWMTCGVFLLPAARQEMASRRSRTASDPLRAEVVKVKQQRGAAGLQHLARPPNSPA